VQDFLTTLDNSVLLAPALRAQAAHVRFAFGDLMNAVDVPDHVPNVRTA
jgi:hypothetical protein